MSSSGCLNNVLFVWQRSCKFPHINERLPRAPVASAATHADHKFYAIMSGACPPCVVFARWEDAQVFANGWSGEFHQGKDTYEEALLRSKISGKNPICNNYPVWGGRDAIRAQAHLLDTWTVGDCLPTNHIQYQHFNAQRAQRGLGPLSDVPPPPTAVGGPPSE